MKRADALRLIGQLEGARVKSAELDAQWDRGRRFEVLNLVLGFRGKRRDVHLTIRRDQIDAHGPLLHVKLDGDCRAERRSAQTPNTLGAMETRGDPL